MNRPLVSRQTPLRVSSQPIRYLNELRALDVLFREGGQSRADLARTLGLNRSTTGNIITNLMADSLVLEQTGPKQESAVLRTGRPGIEVSLDPKGAIFVGAAFEADRLMALMVDLSGTIVRWKTTAFQTAQSRPEQAAKAMAKLINALVTAEPERDHVYGICVAVPAMFEDGVILQATLLGWRNVDLRPLISAHLSRDIPVSVENDANAFAIAETYRGPSPTGGTVAFILIDSGAGGGIVNGGRILRGGAGLAGEFGHLRVGRGGFVRGRGGKGRLETYIGREAVVARYRANGGAAGAELADLVAALERGDVAATRTAKEWAHWFAMGLLSIVNIVNPSLIIVGGPVSAVLKFAMKDVEAKLRANLPRGFPAPKITLSRFGPEGPAYGAALLRHQRAFSIDESALYPSGNGRSLFPKLDS